MRTDKLKEVFSKIDTDTSMDHRIKNQLMYYIETDDKKQYGRYESYYGMTDKTKRSSLSGLTKLRPIITPAIVILFLGVVMFGIRANLFHENETAITPNSTLATDLETPNSTMVPDSETSDSILAVENNLTQEPIEKADFQDTSEQLPEPSGTDTTGKFYFAYFDVVNENNRKVSIPGVYIRLYGTVDIINPDDLTDIVLTRDGVIVENNIYFSGEINPFKWGYEDITDFYFRFTTDNRIPGNYGMTGSYQGEQFSVYNKILEPEITDEPANSDSINSVSFVYFPDPDGNPKEISELAFNFDGLQNAFYLSDLSNVTMRKDGFDIPISFEDRVFRYYEVGKENTGHTSFNVLLTEPIAESGSYSVIGNYRGVEFISEVIIIP